MTVSAMATAPPLALPCGSLLNEWVDRQMDQHTINRCRCVSFGWHLWQVPAVMGVVLPFPTPKTLGALLSGREGGDQCPGSLLTVPGRLHSAVVLRDEALERQPLGIPLGI